MKFRAIRLRLSAGFLLIALLHGPWLMADFGLDASPAGALQPARPAAQAGVPAALRISGVKTSAASFNPGGGERVTLRFTLSAAAAVTLKIFDGDFEAVRTLMDKKPLKAGDQSVSWDGKDAAGTVVPNEAYFFTIEAQGSDGATAVYDPITFSGGEVYDITKVDVDREQGTVTYTLERPARVLIRLGIHNGPLMRTLVDWKPRLPGLVTEYWNGRDESQVVNLREQPNFTMLVTYFTLPENAVVVYGSNPEAFPDYKSRLKEKREKKPERARHVQTARALSPHFLQPRSDDRALKVNLSLPNGSEKNGENVPVVRGLTLVRVDLADPFKKLVSSQQYEIMFFMDQAFFAEEEAGHIPYNFQWDFSNFSEGEHVLTVNIATLKDQIGTASLRIFVKKN